MLLTEIILLALAGLPSVNGAGCPAQFPVGFLSSCFYFSTEILSWADAKSKCSQLDGKLAEPKTARVSQFLRDHVSGTGKGANYFLGGNDLATKGVWVWASDDSNITFTDWAEGEPNDLQRAQDCLQYLKWADYKWDDVGCFILTASICETSTVSGRCPSRFPVNFSSSCFFFNGNKLLWDDAKTACIRRGGKLAEPRNAQVNEFLRNHLNISQIAPGYFLGGHDLETEGEWMWASDNSPITFTDWAEGEPNDERLDEERCIDLNAASAYRWNDQPCNRTQNFICEKSAAAPLTSTTPNVNFKTTPEVTSRAATIPTETSLLSTTSETEVLEKDNKTKIIAPVAGGSAGVVVLLVSIFIVIRICRRRAHRRTSNEDDNGLTIVDNHRSFQPNIAHTGSDHTYENEPAQTSEDDGAYENPYDIPGDLSPRNPYTSLQAGQSAGLPSRRTGK